MVRNSSGTLAQRCTRLLMPVSLSLVLVASCERASKPRSEPEATAEAERGRYGLTSQQAEQPVVVVGQRAVRLETYAELLGPRPRKRGLPPEMERRQQFLDELLQVELLAVEAQRAGIMASAEIRMEQDRLMVQRLLEDISAEQPEVTDEDVRAYYDSHPELYVVPERVQAMHILVSRKAEALDLIAQLKENADAAEFSRLASARSKDAYTATRGGRLSLLRKPRTGDEPKTDSVADVVSSATAAPKPPEELVRAAFELPQQTGLFAEPIHSRAGYHVLFVTRRLPEQAIPLDQVRKRLGEQLAQTRAQDAIKMLVQGLEEKANVRRNLTALAEAL